MYFNTIEKILVVGRGAGGGWKEPLSSAHFTQVSSGAHNTVSIWIWFDCSEVTSSLRTQFRI